MRLTLIGKDPASNPTGSPTVCRTDQGTWVVQGWVATDPGALEQMQVPDGETAVEIPDRMLPFSGGRTVAPVTDEEFEELLRSGFTGEAVHLEMRDAYGTAVELPHMTRWGPVGNTMTCNGSAAGAARCAGTSKPGGPCGGRGSCPSR